MKIVSREEYRNRKLPKDATEQGTGAAPAAPDVVIPDDMARASLALMSNLPTTAEERIELRQKRLEAMQAGDITDDTGKALGYAAEQLERARYLHAKGAADVDIFPLLENADLRLNSVGLAAAANIGLAAEQEKAEQKRAAAENGKAGAKKRHAASDSVKAQVLAEYRKGKWKSKRDAAGRLEGVAKEKAREVSFSFATPDVEERIYKWILEGTKED